MTPNSLAPAFVRLDYTSAYAPHSMTLPTKEWLPTSMGGDMGSYVNWAGAPVDAEASIDNLVAALALQFPSTTTLNLATIYTQAGAHDPAVPVASKTLSTAGSNAAGGPDKATQATLNFRTVGIHPAKVVFLDVPIGTSNFDKVYPAGFSAAILAVSGAMRSDTRMWSGRDDTQLATAISLTITLNERLRREYKQA